MMAVVSPLRALAEGLEEEKDKATVRKKRGNTERGVWGPWVMQLSVTQKNLSAFYLFRVPSNFSS